MFEGRAISGYAGDTVASALLGSGIDVVSRSPILGRPRGVFSAGAEEPNAFVRVNGAGLDPIVPATMVRLIEHLRELRHQLGHFRPGKDVFVMMTADVLRDAARADGARDGEGREGPARAVQHHH